jgi:hypothetical protein
MSVGRGRLLRPMLLELLRIDVEATRTADGFDDVLGSPLITPAADPLDPPPLGAPRGEPATLYHPAVRVRGQVENGLRGLSTNAMLIVQTGNQPKFKIQVVYHYEDLELAGLIAADGHVRFRQGDRLIKIRDAATEDLVCNVEDAYATVIDDTSFGLGAASRNLCIVTYESRARGAPTA